MEGYGIGVFSILIIGGLVFAALYHDNQERAHELALAEQGIVFERPVAPWDWNCRC